MLGPGIDIFYMDGHREHFPGDWKWEISDGLLRVFAERATCVIPLANVRRLEIGES